MNLPTRMRTSRRSTAGRLTVLFFTPLCSGALRVPRKVNLSIHMAKRHSYVGNGILNGDQVEPGSQHFKAMAMGQHTLSLG